MAKNFHQPTRMCLSCRERDIKSKLYRAQCSNGELSAFGGYGRSFYICHACLENDKKLSRALMRQCRSSQKDKLMNKLKEIITDDRKS
jgi:predicted RNA-binding protein YlxR (DUF448 family)